MRHLKNTVRFRWHAFWHRVWHRIATVATNRAASHRWFKSAALVADLNSTRRLVDFP